MNGAGDIRGRNLLTNIDWRIVGLYLALILVGWLNIYASEYDPENVRSIFSWSLRSGKQFVWILTALALGSLVLFVIPFRAFETLAPLAYVCVGFLLVAVIFLGASTRGSHSWFVLGPISFQPAELSKITTSLMLAKFMSRYTYRLSNTRDFLLTLALIFVPMLVIVAENETGTALVYLSFFFMLYREGLSGWLLFIAFMVVVIFILTLTASPYTALLMALAVIALCVSIERNKIKWIFSLYLPLCIILSFLPYACRTYAFLSWLDPMYVLWVAAASCIIGFVIKGYQEKNSFKMLASVAVVLAVIITLSVPFIFEKVLQQHQRTRIEVLLGMKNDPAGAGYNVRQSMIAIGSGGLTGKGYLQGTQSSYGFVPEQSTDFIFCTIGEEWGFLGSVLTILLYVLLIWRIIMRSENSREKFTRIYGYCVASIIFMHLVVNIGMTIGLMPVIGIPLPLVSYGGSSLWAFTVMIFIFVSLCRNEKKYFL